jgi:hypothetical protein
MKFTAAEINHQELLNKLKDEDNSKKSIRHQINMKKVPSFAPFL